MVFSFSTRRWVIIGSILLSMFAVIKVQAQTLSVNLTSSSYNGFGIRCQGGSDGFVHSTVSGGTTPYVYAWSNGSTDTSITGLAAGTYKLVVTDDVGAKDSMTVTLSAPSVLSGSFNSPTHNGFNISCFGGSNGELSTTPSGGVSPYSYLWNTGDTLKDLVGLSQGSYQITITDANGCTKVLDSTMTQPTVLTTSLASPTTASGYPIACHGELNASIDLTVTGGASPYAYDWGSGQISQDISGIGKGWYSVRVEDQNGCTKYDSLEIQEPLQLVVSHNTYEYEPGEFFSCDTCEDGRVSFSVTGGTAPFTFTWAFGNVDTAYTLVPDVWYPYTVTDAAGCSVTDSVRLAANVTIEPLSVVGTRSSYAGGYHVSTYGGTDGSIDLDVMGGVQPYTYSWSNGPTTQDISGIGAGTYTVTVADANSATVQKSFTLIQPSAPLTVTISVNASPSCAGYANGELEAFVSGGTPPYGYEWSIGGTNVKNENLPAGNYTVTVWDANNDTITESIELTEPAPITTSIVPSFDQSGYQFQCAGDTIQLDLTVNGGVSPYDYLWDNGKFTQDISVSASGWYHIRVTGTNGCVKRDSVYLTAPQEIMLSQPDWFTYPNGELFSCDTCNDALVTMNIVGGVTPYASVTMQSASTTLVGPAFTGIHADTAYTFTVVDAIGCVLYDEGPDGLGYSIPREGFNQLEVFADLSTYSGGYNISTHGGNDGWINLNISGQMSQETVTWSDGFTGRDRYDLTAGTYQATVTDNAGQSVTKSWTLTQPANGLLVSISNTNGPCSGSAYLQSYVNGGTPPYSYQWLDGTGMSIGSGWSYFSTTNPDTYQLIVVDANSDTTVAFYQYAINSGLSASVTSPFVLDTFNIGCDENDGMIDIVVSGGSAPYEITVDDYQGYHFGLTANDSVAQIDSLKAGIYYVKIKDINSCIVNKQVTLVSPHEEIEMDANWFTYPNGKLFSCDTCNDAQLTLVLQGVIEPFTASLISSSMTINGPVFTGIHADTAYTVRMVDGLGCIKEMTGEEALVVPRDGFSSLQVYADLSTYPGGYNISTHGGNDGWINLNISGQMSQETVTWSDGFTGRDRYDLTAGTYQATVTDNAGQSVTKSWTLTQPSNMLQVSINNQSGPCANPAYLEAFVTGGTPPYTYQWKENGMDVGDPWSYHYAYMQGDYTVEVVDANNDTTTSSLYVNFSSFWLNVYSPMNAGGANVSCAADDGIIEIQINGGAPPYTVTIDDYAGFYSSFSTSDTLVQIDSLSAKYYNINVTSIGGCNASYGITLNEVQPIQANVGFQTYPPNNTIFSCDSCNDATVVLDITGGSAPYTVNWSTGQSGDTHYNTYPDSTIFYGITDAMGCGVSDSIRLSRGMSADIQLVVEKSQYAGGYNVSGADASDGSISLTVIGGQSPFNVTWFRYDPVMMYEYELGYSGQTYVDGLQAGQYRVEVTDMNMEYAERTVMLTAPINPLNASISGNYNSCNSYGHLNVYVNGGTPPYNYQWYQDGMATGGGWAYLDIYSSGTYAVVVNDMNGDSAYAEMSFSDSLAFTANVWSPVIGSLSEYDPGYNASCTGNDGSIVIEVLSGTPPFTVQVDGSSDDYKKSSNSSTYMATSDAGAYTHYSFVMQDSVMTIDSLSGGNYQIRINDASGGCEQYFHVEIMRKRGLQVKATPSKYPNGYYFSCDTCSDGNITASVLDGVGPYNYMWFELPEGIFDGIAFKVEGASIFLSGLDMEGVDFGDSLAQELIVSTDSVFISAKPEQPYLLVVADAQGCVGMAAMLLERPHPNAGSVVQCDRLTSCEDSTTVIRGQWIEDTTKVYVCPDVQVGIGTNVIPDGYALGVAGKVMAEEVEVRLQTAWPDYVFEDTYERRSLQEVSEYVAKNGHLPDVPSAKEVEERGVRLGEMDAILLRKIEELTLYMIELKKENDDLKVQLNNLQK